MQSENFDNKIKQAAEQHHPDYDEKAWAKMKKLLDLHLPQKDDRRRRIIFFLLFSLLVGGGAWLVISKPWQQSNQTLSTVNTLHKDGAEPPAASTNKTTEKQTPGNTFADKKKDKEIKDSEVRDEPLMKEPLIRNKMKDIVTDGVAGNSKRKSDQNIIVADDNVNADRNKQDIAIPAKTNKADQLTVDAADAGKIKKDKKPHMNNAIVTSPDDGNDKAMKNENIKTSTVLPADNDVSQSKITETKKDSITEQLKTDSKKDIAKRNKSKKSNSFFFSFSSGPDISSVGFDKPGKVKLLAGAGFGYSFKNKWVIRTGFYTGRKVYSANKDQYKPSVPPFNYNYIENIDAECKVYEIPVSLSYIFGRSSKQSLFASAGLSSYIMKNEKYVYLYKWPSGQTYQYTKTVNNENNHYFSVLTLSAGYQRKINKTFSIAAEPYFKLPLAGVGYGKVKLNSAGILFSVNISAFQKGTKK